MEKGQGKGTDTLQTDKVFTRKEYIEREAAIAFMNEVEPCICHNPDGAVFTATKDSDMLEFLRAIPAADVVPVRHGKWIKATGMMPPEYCGLHICSECGHYAGRKPPYGGKEMLSDYCPNCGARMDGDEDV